jgi:hypothetical protein
MPVSCIEFVILNLPMVLHLKDKDLGFRISDLFGSCILDRR